MDSFSVGFNTCLDPSPQPKSRHPLLCPIVIICVPAHLVFLCPYSFAFSRRSYKWIWTIYNLFRLASLTQPEKAMAPHSSTLAWKIPWTEEPDRLQSMGSLRVRQDWVTSLSLFTFMHWRRKWQPTPVFLPGKSQGRGSLVGCHLWGCTESDTTEVT